MDNERTSGAHYCFTTIYQHVLCERQDDNMTWEDPQDDCSPKYGIHDEDNNSAGDWLLCEETGSDIGGYGYMGIWPHTNIYIIEEW